MNMRSSPRPIVGDALIVYKGSESRGVHHSSARISTATCWLLYCSFLSSLLLSQPSAQAFTSSWASVILSMREAALSDVRDLHCCLTRHSISILIRLQGTSTTSTARSLIIWLPLEIPATRGFLDAPQLRLFSMNTRALSLAWSEF